MHKTGLQQQGHLEAKRLGQTSALVRAMTDEQIVDLVGEPVRSPWNIRRLIGDRLEREETAAVKELTRTACQVAIRGMRFYEAYVVEIDHDGQLVIRPAATPGVGDG